MLTSFLAGFLSASFAFALFSHREQAEKYTETDGIIERNVIMSCATCRKLTRHEEIEPRLFKCKKCERHIDLRVS